jgi:uncharacterized membrane protein HdeD (DUF308 family)
MLERLTAHWWIPVIRGAIAIIFGVVAIGWPGETIVVLVLIFGAFCVIDGVLAIITAIRYATHHEKWAVLFLEGIVGIIIGLLALSAPAAIALFFVAFVAGWAVITGIFEIIAAFRVRQSIASELFLLGAGVLSILLGVIIFLIPVAAVIAWAWMIGIYAIVAGAFLIVFGFRLRKLAPTPG